MSDDDTDRLVKDERQASSADSFRMAWTASGLHTESEIASFFENLPPELAGSDGKSVAQHAARQGRLTPFQAQAMLMGRAKALVLGSYAILDKIGQGGMGTVYRAKHLRMGRVVAIKVLPAATMRTPEAIRRFQKEIQAAAKLSHPNIVTAFDAGEANKIHFLVMEYVDGQDLKTVVRQRGPLPVAHAIDYLTQAARGLEAAHRQGIIHRDIKPENLLLDFNGTVKILDMGLARIAESLEEDAGASLTRVGQVLGTPDYMAPEQGMDTKRAEVRSDIYSLGCTLHTLLIGRPPFEGKSLVEKILAHRDQAIPSLCQQRSDIPDALDRLFQSMVAKRVEDRPSSMAVLIESLESLQKVASASADFAPTVSFTPPAEAAETVAAAHRLTSALDRRVERKEQDRAESGVKRSGYSLTSPRDTRGPKPPDALAHPRRFRAIGIATVCVLVTAVGYGLFRARSGPDLKQEIEKQTQRLEQLFAQNELEAGQDLIAALPPEVAATPEIRGWATRLETSLKAEQDRQSARSAALETFRRSGLDKPNLEALEQVSKLSVSDVEKAEVAQARDAIQRRQEELKVVRDSQFREELSRYTKLVNSIASQSASNGTLQQLQGLREEIKAWEQASAGTMYDVEKVSAAERARIEPLFRSLDAAQRKIEEELRVIQAISRIDSKVGDFPGFIRQLRAFSEELNGTQNASDIKRALVEQPLWDAWLAQTQLLENSRWATYPDLSPDNVQALLDESRKLLSTAISLPETSAIQDCLRYLEESPVDGAAPTLPRPSYRWVGWLCRKTNGTFELRGGKDLPPKTKLFCLIPSNTGGMPSASWSLIGETSDLKLTSDDKTALAGRPVFAIISP